MLGYMAFRPFREDRDPVSQHHVLQDLEIPLDRTPADLAIPGHFRSVQDAPCEKLTCSRNLAKDPMFLTRPSSALPPSYKGRHRSSRLFGLTGAQNNRQHPQIKATFHGKAEPISAAMKGCIERKTALPPRKLTPVCLSLRALEPVRTKRQPFFSSII